ncbi:FAD binding domain-containing protein [Dothidotthia symphoricarpi CBS 119687]|uniref:FAD binding domain-containing protein n=1 Tax=Dothidotthia symphoricarpi CBS 119687 TaxID=1392245 RepID=A0A6A6ALZ6_9PLEO|nr:FAD binding domain-containing protein [Dothidotthia symphoricarpi CBS 119687]KAF2133002.1 FAD binding domain-containing protein [Dothidotthia symphoricarpi CBS 119687]
MVFAQSSSFVDIGPAATLVPVTSAAGAPLQKGETLQLTDSVIGNIATHTDIAQFAAYFAFDENNETLTRSTTLASCKTFPGDSTWPKDYVWDLLNVFLGGALIPTVPIAASCYDTQWGAKDATECSAVINNFTNPLFHHSDPTSGMWPIFQGRTCMPIVNATGKHCKIGGYPEYAVKVTNVAQIQLAINFARTTDIRLVIKNTGHCYLGKSSGAGALSLWTHNMKDIDFLPNYEGPGYSGPALKLAAGVTVREVYEAADKNNVTVLGAVSWSVGYAGGMITGGGQNPLAGLYGMSADHVVAFQVVTASGHFITVSEASNPDLFWALCGGGGGTFAVVTSVIIRAHPKLDVVTANWVLDATTNDLSSFWAGTKKFFDVFLEWADAGIYSFFIMGNAPAPFLNMMFLFAPNHTEGSYNKVVQPFFDYLKMNNITLTSPHKNTAHTSFYSAYQSTWGANSFPIGLDNSLPANRIVPRVNFQEKFNETFSLIKKHVSSGKHFLGYHKAPVKYANTNNAVSPAWRECAMFFVTSSNKSLDHSTPEALAIANNDLQQNILQPWRDITPVSEGGGTYLNEAAVMEPDWQESFYGGYYPKLSEIKKKWDPRDVFYATTAVGSERWVVQDGEQGVQTQNGKLCRAAR